jgi:2-polyprenyl-3-methyl-5-hydroxy-6-metoxy-1,4-benzoquinol methylase
MKSPELVRDYFERRADRFDAVYEARKPLRQRAVDRVFRRVVIERFRLITNLAPLPGDWTALDVGCGPGRYSIALAAAGATRVLGVDAATSMVDLARDLAAEEGVSERCEFRNLSFLDLDLDERFEVVVATGYFDYLEDPAAHLHKMVDCCRGRIFVSFPKRWELRAAARKLRFALARGYVRFYSATEVRDLIREAGVPPDRASLIDLGRDWIAVLRIDPGLDSV